MRRIALFVVSTMAVIVLLFSYKTSRPVASAQSAALGGAAHIVSGPAVVRGNAVTTSAPPPAPKAAQSSTPAAGASAPAGADGSTTKNTPAPKAGAARQTTAAPKTTAAAKTSAAATTSAAAPVVVDGSAVDTNYGPVQVEVTISNKKITKVTVPQYPSGSGRDAEINSYAIPQLVAEVLSAQSATIDGVSGATYTTQGFQASLQSALDAASFGK